MIETLQLLFVYAIYCTVVSVPTILIFAAARRTIRPRNYLPTGKLTVVSLVLSLALAFLLDVEFSGDVFAVVVYVTIVTPLVALVIVLLWFLLNKLVAWRAPKPRATSSVE